MEIFFLFLFLLHKMFYQKIHFLLCKFMGFYDVYVNASCFQLVERFLCYCGGEIHKAQLYQARVRDYQQNQLLLNLAKSLFQEQTSLDRLITNIIVEAKKMLKCERCTIFLLDLKMYDQVSKIHQSYKNINSFKDTLI